ncbi:FMN-binding negative transcriptional regulator [Sessilibacter sp. MAH1]
MNIPSKFKITDSQLLIEFIRQYSLGTLIVNNDSGLDANHIPFLVQTIKDQNGNLTIKLEGHVAHNNSLVGNSQDNQSVLVVFHGPNGYISPNFYPSKLATGKAVPTWNYSAVHVKGTIRFIHDQQWLLNHIQQLSDFHEAHSQTQPWSVNDAPKDYIKKMLQAVVGIEITASEMVGNFKHSQNKSDTDYAGVIEGLRNSPSDNDRLLQQSMTETKGTSD